MFYRHIVSKALFLIVKKVEAVEQPWIHLDDALMDYLYELMADSHYQAQVRNSRIRGKLFYTEVGKFIVDNIHYLKFQNMRSWTEQNKMKKVLEWGKLSVGIVKHGWNYFMK